MSCSCVGLNSILHLVSTVDSVFFTDSKSLAFRQSGKESESHFGYRTKLGTAARNNTRPGGCCFLKYYECCLRCS